MAFSALSCRRISSGASARVRALVKAKRVHVPALRVSAPETFLDMRVLEADLVADAALDELGPMRKLREAYEALLPRVWLRLLRTLFECASLLRLLSRLG